MRPGSKNIQLTFVLVGDNGSGKDSLLRRYADNQFNGSRLGVEFKIRSTQSDDITIRNQVWLSGGRSRFETLRAIWYRSCHAAILCINLADTNGLSAARDWLKQRNMFDGGIVAGEFFIVGTQSDRCDSLRERTRAIEALAAEYGVVYVGNTSARTGVNVDEVFKKISVATMQRELKKERNAGDSIARVNDPDPYPSFTLAPPQDPEVLSGINRTLPKDKRTRRSIKVVCLGAQAPSRAVAKAIHDLRHHAEHLSSVTQPAVRKNQAGPKVITEQVEWHVSTYSDAETRSETGVVIVLNSTDGPLALLETLERDLNELLTFQKPSFSAPKYNVIFLSLTQQYRLSRDELLPDQLRELLESTGRFWQLQMMNTTNEESVLAESARESLRTYLTLFRDALLKSKCYTTQTDSWIEPSLKCRLSSKTLTPVSGADIERLLGEIARLKENYHPQRSRAVRRPDNYQPRSAAAAAVKPSRPAAAATVQPLKRRATVRKGRLNRDTLPETGFEDALRRYDLSELNGEKYGYRRPRPLALKKAIVTFDDAVRELVLAVELGHVRAVRVLFQAMPELNIHARFPNGEEREATLLEFLIEGYTRAEPRANFREIVPAQSRVDIFDLLRQRGLEIIPRGIFDLMVRHSQFILLNAMLDAGMQFENVSYDEFMALGCRRLAPTHSQYEALRAVVQRFAEPAAPAPSAPRAVAAADARGVGPEKEAPPIVHLPTPSAPPAPSARPAPSTATERASSPEVTHGDVTVDAAGEANTGEVEAETVAETGIVGGVVNTSDDVASRNDSAVMGDVDEQRPPEHFCSISSSVMSDPVVAKDGNTYERAEIERWFEECRRRGRPPTSPLTNAVIAVDLTPNNYLKKLIADWKPPASVPPSVVDAAAGQSVDVEEAGGEARLAALIESIPEAPVGDLPVRAPVDGVGVFARPQMEDEGRDRARQRAAPQSA